MSFANNTYVLERLAAGKVPKASAIQMVGFSAGLTTTYETVWDEGTLYAFNTAAMSSPTISSASANDTSAGTGARTCRVTGVNTSYVAFTEDLTMNGQTGVALTTANVLAINSIEVLTAGSTGTNAGIIYVGEGAITTGKPATVHGLVAASFGRSTSAIYTVPASNKLLIKSFRASQTGATTASTFNAVFETITDGGPKLRKFLTGGVTSGGPISDSFDVPIMIPEKTKFQVLALASAITAGFCYLNCILLNQDATDTQATWI